MDFLKQDIQYLKGVGPNRKVLLNNLGIYNINDLITYFPRDYEDRTKKKQIFELLDGEKISFDATVCVDITVSRVRGNMVLIKTRVNDDTGTVSLTWFNSPYVKTSLASR